MCGLFVEEEGKGRVRVRVMKGVIERRRSWVVCQSVRANWRGRGGTYE